MLNLIGIACFFALVATSWCTNETQDLKTGKIFTKGGNIVTFECYGNALDKVGFPLFEVAYDIEFVDLVDCATPRTTYATELSRISPKFGHFKELSLTYQSLSTKISYDPKYFEGLSVESLNINGPDCNPKLQINSTSFLMSLKLLRKFMLDYIDSPPLPLISQLDHVSYRNAGSKGAFGGCDYLTGLTFEEWNLEAIPKYWLAKCSKLKVIYMIDMINLTSEQLQRVLEGLNSLTDLAISGSKFDAIPTSVFNNAENVEKLIFVRNKFSKLLLRNIKMKSLSYLVLSDMFELEGFPQIQTSVLTLDLCDNFISFWNVTETDYELFIHNKKLLIVVGDHLKLKLNCDCQHGWLVRVLRSGYLQLPQAKCLDGTELTTVTRESVECNKFQCGECTCRRQWSDNTTVARCSGKATRVPRVRDLRALHAAGNRIHTLSSHDLPDTLLFLDLRHNHLSSMDAEAIAVLFSVSGRRMKLGGNDFACNCANHLLIAALLTYKLQVEDFENLVCIQAKEIRELRNVSLSELCAKEVQLKRKQLLWTALGVSAVLLGVAAVVGVVYWRYRRHIKVYLYARGYCTWCVREDDVDSDRPYDAFLSFSHRDESFVLQELLPRLDTEYKLCLHFRDWVLGDFIPAQITRSVEQSRRTIIVLSRNFLESIWGMVEFRTAYTTSMQEGRARLIIIVLDDVVDDENLSPELRGYIKTNTYLRWGDKWFWQRLRYAMPRRLQPAESSSGRSPATPMHTLNG